VANCNICKSIYPRIVLLEGPYSVDYIATWKILFCHRSIGND